jgi:hypothetical protein
MKYDVKTYKIVLNYMLCIFIAVFFLRVKSPQKLRFSSVLRS